MYLYNLKKMRMESTIIEKKDSAGKMFKGNKTTRN